MNDPKAREAWLKNLQPLNALQLRQMDRDQEQGVGVVDFLYNVLTKSGSEMLADVVKVIGTAKWTQPRQHVRDVPDELQSNAGEKLNNPLKHIALEFVREKRLEQRLENVGDVDAITKAHVERINIKSVEDLSNLKDDERIVARLVHMGLTAAEAAKISPDGGDLDDLNTPDTLAAFSDDELDEVAAANNSYKQLDAKLLVAALTTVTAHVRYLQLHTTKMEEFRLKAGQDVYARLKKERAGQVLTLKALLGVRGGGQLMRPRVVNNLSASSSKQNGKSNSLHKVLLSNAEALKMDAKNIQWEEVRPSNMGPTLMDKESMATQLWVQNHIIFTEKQKKAEVLSEKAQIALDRAV